MTDKEVLVEMLRRGDAEAGYKLGMLAAADGNYFAAERYYRAGVSLGHVRSMTALGTMYFMIFANRFMGYNMWFMAAENGSVPAMSNLALAYYQNGKLDEAEHYWNMAARNGLPEGYLGLGKIAMSRQELDTAEKYFRKAGEMGCTAALNDLAIVLQKLGRSEEAKTVLESAVSRGDMTARSNLERILKKGV
ncbi:MAG: tetratricopeptide repeat protein [Ruminiclostridium sp.]|nr:tetratricopeptide repeat protein [Ruminiclostridium sp.]